MSYLIDAGKDFVASERVPTWHEPAIGSVLYLTVIFWLLKKRKGGGEGWLKDSQALKIAGIIHNTLLIILSASMFVGGSISIKERFVDEGYDGIFCSNRPSAKVLDGRAGFWLNVFYYSKFYELLDTCFLCLKGKNVIFLHVYHHVSMLWITHSWLAAGWFEGSVWCLIVNSAIHTAMYSYYLLSLLKIRCSWKKYLTVGQLVQFATGVVYVAIYLYKNVERVPPIGHMEHAFNSTGGSDMMMGCGTRTRYHTALASLGVNFSFIALFSRFFGKTYAKKRKAL